MNWGICQLLFQQQIRKVTFSTVICHWDLPLRTAFVLIVTEYFESSWIPSQWSAVLFVGWIWMKRIEVLDNWIVGSMAKMINERASTSAEISPTPDSSAVATHVQQLADNMYNKVAVYLQGQIEGISYD